MKWVFAAIVMIIAATSMVAAQNSNTANDNLRDRNHNNVTVYVDPIDYTAVSRNLQRASGKSFGQRMAETLRKPLLRNSDTDAFKMSGTFGIGYTQETNFSIAAIGRGEYSLNSRDTLTLPSEINAAVVLSVSGFYAARISGRTIFSGNKNSLSYSLRAGSMPMRFWGLGYSAADNVLRTDYTRKQYAAQVCYMRQITTTFAAGAEADFRYAEAGDLTPIGMQYLTAQAQQRSAVSTGFGAVAEYDTRRGDKQSADGIYLALTTEMRPKFLGDNRSTLWHITATADYYRSVWTGGMVAVDLYADLWSSATSWLFWPTLGGDSRLRGYYTGRYSDRKLLSAQVELRQHIYGIIGGCVWAGAANVFPSHKVFDWSHTLPNYGVGLRLKLGGTTALRVDYGFGRHSDGLIINVNEAF